MGYGSLLFNVFRYFLKTIRSFIVQFCTDPLVTVIPLLLYSLKSFTLRTLLLVILFFAHFGVSSFTWEQFSISHEIWHKFPWNDFDDHYTKKNTTVCPTLLVAKFGGFFGPFWSKVVYFLGTAQYFIVKICTDIVAITPIITKQYTGMLPSPRNHFGVLFGLWYLSICLENVSRFSHILHKTSRYYSFSH